MTLPPYQHYGVPQQRPSRPWLWALVGALVGAAVTAAAGVAIIIGIGIWMLDGDYMGTDPDVIDATRHPCEEVADAARDLPRFSGTADGAEALDRVSTSLVDVTDAIEASGTSEDASLAWRRDLSELADRVADYALAVAEGDLTAPDLGASTGLIERIDFGAPSGCEIPAALAALDPDYADYWSEWG